ncbi:MULTISPECIES: S1C family serine protease [unclassified Streptomyces]|uniref:S1C family serine protease n=1 Tax=unclassified Streptomyces TaxID=2593676 RepID=UPI00278BCAF2|nr:MULTISPECIES: S1C family serine protease [unclassified Streptomyces]
MEQTALRPKPMPGSGGGPGPGPGRPTRSEPPRKRARPYGRRLCGALCGLLCAVLLVLAGIGLGTVGATVIGMSKLAELKKQAPPAAKPAPARPSAAPLPGMPPALPSLARGGLGVEVVDAPKGAGALVVAVHIPGPGHTGGLVRGDVLVALGTQRVGSALDLAATVADTADARPGRQVVVTVRHADGELQKLAVTPGVAT